MTEVAMHEKRRFVAALVVVVPAALCACASILGIEPVAYEGDDGGAEATTTPPPDASDASDACSGSTCGGRCCAKGATCIDGGVCSTDVVAVSGGGTVSCALIADGTVYCWGENMLGQVGVAPAGDDTCTFFPGGGASIDEPCRWHPTRVQGLPPVSGVWAGAQLACAIEADGGAVWCWGRNATGALGHDPSGDPRCSDLNELADGATTATPVPCSSTPRRVDGISDVVELAVGTDTVCARTKAGSVSCWGGGDNGERGDGEGGVRATPGPVVGLPANDPITQIAAPTFVPSTCAVSASGHAWCWGAGLVIESGGPTASPVTGGTARPLTGLVEIRPAEGFICARQSSGIVICWGFDDNGYLGRGQCTAGVLDEDTVIGLPKNVALDSRWSHACALDDAGTVRCWGFGENGAVGVGGIAGDPVCSTPGARPTPASVLSVPPMAQIATGIETTFAITRDGKLWAWGANDLARIGHEPNTGGDLINCGTANKTICDPVPKPVPGLP